MVATDHADGVHQEHHRNRLHCVPVVQVLPGTGLDLVECHRLALQWPGHLHHGAARLAPGRREDRHQPGGIGSVEVPPIQLLGDRPAGADRRIRLSALHQVGQSAGRCGDHDEEEQAVHVRTGQSVLAGSLTAAGVAVSGGSSFAAAVATAGPEPELFPEPEPDA